ncbi:MAG: 3-dehydroquinate synthase [Clostridia bacterium]
MNIFLDLKEDSYDIVLERGSLQNAAQILDMPQRKVMIISDSGVPTQYIDTLKSQFDSAYTFIFEQGEQSKNFDTFKSICEYLLECGFSRKDCVIALGGGVVGDLSGFAASAYMRGIDFYNIPTTFLSQVDSSIGGKTAIDLGKIKNIIGAFYQPKKVIIDPDVLTTLSDRHLKNGLAESIKMGLTNDKNLFELFEQDDYLDNLDKIIELSLLVKRMVVQEDEKELGLRKVLNFGHTIGHGIEASTDLELLYHGECVALGMLAMCGEELKIRLSKVLEKVGLPTSFDYDKEIVFAALTHDKKANGKKISIVTSEAVGTFEFKEVDAEQLKALL